jgi:hypothetical protein
MIRGAVWHAMRLDCLATQRKGSSEKPDRLDKESLLLGWMELDPRREGKTIEEAITAAADQAMLYPTLRSALLGLSRDGKLPTVNTVTYKLRSMKNTPISKMRFEVCHENRSGARLWRVVEC